MTSKVLEASQLWFRIKTNLLKINWQILNLNKNWQTKKRQKMKQRIKLKNQKMQKKKLLKIKKFKQKKID